MSARQMTCPQCRGAMWVGPDLCGQKVRCPQCTQLLRVPEFEVEPEPEPWERDKFKVGYPQSVRQSVRPAAIPEFPERSQPAAQPAAARPGRPVDPDGTEPLPWLLPIETGPVTALARRQRRVSLATPWLCLGIAVAFGLLVWFAGSRTNVAKPTGSPKKQATSTAMDIEAPQAPEVSVIPWSPTHAKIVGADGKEPPECAVVVAWLAENLHNRKYEIIKWESPQHYEYGDVVRWSGCKIMMTFQDCDQSGTWETYGATFYLDARMRIVAIDFSGDHPWRQHAGPANEERDAAMRDLFVSASRKLADEHRQRAAK